MERRRAGILLAAGKGTRMCSSLPKVLHKVCGQTLLERSLRAFAGLDCSELILVLGSGESEIRAELEELSVPGLKIVRQEKQLGTGDAARCAFEALDKTDLDVIIAPGDIPLLRTETLAAGLESHGESAVSFLSFEALDPTGFGRVLRDSDNSVQAIVEHKDCSEAQLSVREVNSGIYFTSRCLLGEALESLTNENSQGEYYLTDIVSFAVAKGSKVSAHKVLNPRDVAGANTRLELGLLEQYRRLEINAALMLSGVSFEDPNSAYIDEGIEVGRDSFIGAGTRLKGSSRLGEEVHIEGDCLIENCSVGDKTRVKIGCSLEDSVIGKDCSIGPFAHLRPNTLLEDDVKVGNFVETKKAELKTGVKAGHLSYLGDAVIHPRVNIGAGTITCNYDGEKKHQTTIRADSFIGSNSCLVAPVNLGEGAYVAAGSTITKDVPSGALAFGRSRQSNKTNWKKR